MTISRRRFLAGLGLGVGAAAAGSYGISVWAQDEGRDVESSDVQAGSLTERGDRRTLVVLELGGGNDALNTVVPIGAGAGRYHDLRPTLAVADPLALDDDIGLHPNLARLAKRYRAGDVAIVEGVGYEPYDLSHFGSLAIWWSAAGGAGQAGWLGRYLDGTVGFDDPLAGVSIGPSPSPAMLGTQSFSTSIADPTGLRPGVPAWVGSPEELLAAWRGFAPAKVDASTLLGRVRGAIGAGVDAQRELVTVLDGREADPTPLGSESAYGEATAALDLAARVAQGDDPPRIVYVHGLGDYDTHQGQAARHPALMADVDTGIGRFFDAMEAAGIEDRVTLMTASEFGRRPAENGGGTDHGTASTHFVIGANVRGGRHGEPHDLTRLDRSGNLAAPIDFRSLYATMLEGWLGVDAGAVLGEEHPTLALFA